MKYIKNRFLHRDNLVTPMVGGLAKQEKIRTKSEKERKMKKFTQSLFFVITIFVLISATGCGDDGAYTLEDCGEECSPTEDNKKGEGDSPKPPSTNDKPPSTSKEEEEDNNNPPPVENRDRCDPAPTIDLRIYDGNCTQGAEISALVQTKDARFSQVGKVFIEDGSQKKGSLIYMKPEATDCQPVKVAIAASGWNGQFFTSSNMNWWSVKLPQNVRNADVWEKLRYLIGEPRENMKFEINTNSCNVQISCEEIYILGTSS